MWNDGPHLIGLLFVVTGIWLLWQGHALRRLQGFLGQLQGRERQAREESRFLQAIIDAAPANICVLDEQGVIIATNAAWRSFAAENTAGAESKHVGVNYLDVCDAAAPELPEAGAIAAAIRTQLQGGASTYYLEYSCHSPSVKRWFVVTVSPFRQDRLVRLLIIHRDFTGRHLAEMALAESERRYRALFAKMLDGFALHELVVDAAGRPVDYVFLEVNEAFGRLTGLDPAGLRGKRVTEVIPDIAADPAGWIPRYGEVALTGRETRFEHHSAALDRWFSVLAYSPQRGQFATVFEDISERKAALEQLARSNRELEERVRERTAELHRAKDAAERANGFKSLFLSTMSHELRTPLNSIAGFTSILLEELPGPLTAEQRNQLGMVKASAGHLLSLINDVLDLAKIEAGRFTLNVAEFDLAAGLREWTDSLMPQLRERGLTLRLDLPDEPVELKGDRRRIGEIVLNLLANAVKHAAEGAIEVTLDAAAERADGRWITVRVADRGPGVPVAERERIFEPYVQLPQGVRPTRSGTGLGLSISRRLAEQMGGALNVGDRPGGGAVFALRLPCRRVD